MRIVKYLFNLFGKDFGEHIVFEGPEGCGKSAVSQTIFKKLSENEVYPPCIHVKEPGGTVVGADIREVLLKNRSDNIPFFGITEVGLYTSDRVQLFFEKVLTILKGGGLVISDRSLVTQRAIQGGARGVPAWKLILLNFLFFGFFRPTIVVYLDVDSEIGLERKIKQGKLNRLDNENLEFHTAVRKEYLKLYKRSKFIPFGTKWIFVNTNNRELNEVIDETYHKLTKYLDRQIS